MMGIGCDHLLSGRGRCDYALLRYLVLLSQLGVCASCVSAVRGRLQKCYARDALISSIAAVDFSDKRSDRGLASVLWRWCGAGAGRGEAALERGDRAPHHRGTGASGQPLSAKPAEGLRCLFCLRVCRSAPSMGNAINV